MKRPAHPRGLNVQLLRGLCLALGLAACSGPRDAGRQSGAGRGGEAGAAGATHQVSGQVTLADGSDHTGIQVFVPGDSRLIVFTGAKGDFLLSGLRQNRSYEIWAQRSGYETALLKTLVLDADSPALVRIGDYALPPQSSPAAARFGSIVGLALLASQDLHGGIAVTLDSDARSIHATNHDGLYSIKHVPAGKHTLHFARPGFETARLQNLEIRAGEELKAPRVTLQPAADDAATTGGVRSISGAVRFSGVDAVTAEMYQSVVIGLDEMDWAITPDYEGLFLISGLPPGVYTLLASAPGFEIARLRNLDLTQGDLPAVIVDLIAGGELNPAPASLEGAAYYADGNADHSGILIGLEGTGFTALTDRAGRFRITGIPEGVYRLSAQAQGYETVQLDGLELSAPRPNVLPEIVLDPLREYPAVIYTSPADGAREVLVQNYTPVFVRFSKKMQPDSVLNALRISPSVEFRAWIGRDHPQSDYDLLYLELKATQTDQPLLYNTHYTVEISDRAADYENLRLLEPFRFSFRTGKAAVTGTFPADGESDAVVSAEYQPVTIFFNCRLDPNTINYRNIRVTPRAGSTPVFATTVNPRTGWSEVELKTEWRENTNYTVTLTRSVRAADGSVPDNVPYRFSFRTARKLPLTVY